jgi:hypothetical protein
MDPVVGQVQEEGALVMAFEKIDGAIGEEIGKVLVLGIIDCGIGFELEVFPCADDRFIEPTLARMVFPRISDMPFAEHAGEVAGFFQLRSDRVAVQWKLGDIIDRAEGSFGPIETIDTADGVDTCSSRMLST